MKVEKDLLASLDSVVEAIAEGARVRRYWNLLGGISAQMTGLEAVMKDGRLERFILRRRGSSETVAMEYRLLELLTETAVPAPVPVLIDISGMIFPEPFLVLRMMHGRPDYARRDVLATAEKMAAALAEIHALDIELLASAGLPNQKLRLERRARADSGPYDEGMDQARILTIVKENWSSQLDERAHLVHGDFWPGNILWRDEVICGIIDWEDAELGDPLLDVAISRLDVLWIYGFEAMDAFTQCYRSLTGANYQALPFWDLVCALRPAFSLAEWASGWPALGRPDITEVTMRERHRFFVQQAIEGIAKR